MHVFNTFTLLLHFFNQNFTAFRLSSVSLGKLIAERVMNINKQLMLQLLNTLKLGNIYYKTIGYSSAYLPELPGPPPRRNNMDLPE